MISFEVARARVGAAVLLLVAALPATPQAGANDDEQRNVAERIEEARSQGGPYSKELIDPLTVLADLYRESGDHNLSAAVTEQALQVIRANYGLRSLDQVPLIRERIRGEEERGDFALAWELEQALLTLARANPRDMRSAAVFREIGDKRMDLLQRYDAGEFPPQMVLGCYYDEPRAEALHERYVGGSCIAGNRRVAIRALLADAQRNYAAAIAVLLAAGQYTSTELRGLELDLTRSTYRYGGNYQIGRQSLRRLIAYDVASAAPLASRAATLVHIADWDLLYEHRPLALETYEATYDLLQREGVEQPALDELFAPEIPVVLPAFQRNPLVTRPSDEHIDVSFEITRFGTTGRVKVLATTANVSKETERQLVRIIERRRFRPRTVDGEFPRSVPIRLRYYVSN